MDLSIDVEMNSSITSCLRQFSASETLCHKNKYFCDVCSGLQEAERRYLLQMRTLCYKSVLQTNSPYSLKNENQKVTQHISSSFEAFQISRTTAEIHQINL